MNETLVFKRKPGMAPGFKRKAEIRVQGKSDTAETEKRIQALLR